MLNFTAEKNVYCLVRKVFYKILRQQKTTSVTNRVEMYCSQINSFKQSSFLLVSKSAPFHPHLKLLIMQIPIRMTGIQ